MKITELGIILTIILLTILLPSFTNEPGMTISQSYNIDSLGACQGVSNQNGKIFMYGDREVGMIREYKMEGDSLLYNNKEMKLTLNDTDVINHPTGIAYHDNNPVFLGNSIRLNKEGTLWRAVIYCIDWQGLQRTGTLDGNLLNTIDDDTCIQGTRPEYVQYKKKWYVATADYGDKANEVRLYDPSLLKKAKKTSEKGVLYKKFTCTPWVQNLYWMADKGILVLIQNQIEGRKWRFTYVDLEKSIAEGKQSVIKVIDIDRSDELEGFTFLNNKYTSGIAVTSSRKNNVNMININW
ncbi:hypothetical protein [Ferruginibacter sp. SUN106]|uniref:hypothetical protein n=1 Tax=Ferruginibacter sp. SUN106 TaxID=2978348 RepID=UPI003D3626C7